jgi:hypothetical protein
MLYKNDSIFKKSAYVFFISFFLIGCFIYSDYGISTDEEVQRYVIGEANYNFIKSGDSKKLLANDGKYHGPAFELILYAAEKGLNIIDERRVYLFRHLLTFLIFFIASLFFYLLALKIFKYHFAALLSVLMLVISPRIFAESFYNSKDIPMLCFCIISTYTMFLFVEKQTILSALIHAAVCGFTIDIRIIGLLVPIATVYFYCFQKTKKAIPFTMFIGYLIIFVIAFWPVFWLGPWYHLKEALKQMSKYPGDGATLYMGSFVPIQNVPWHYLPVWICVTIPLFYIILFLLGLVFVVKNTLKNFKSTVPIQLFLFVFASPILAVIILHSTIYDSWRHIYFVYPFLILIAVYGFLQLIQTIKNPVVLNTVVSFTVVSFIFTSFFMIKNHPYQNVYFNILAGNNIREKYELDYWGLSYKQGLEYILAHDPSAKVQITSDKSDMDLTPLLNFGIIPAKERNRLEYTYDLKSANYFVTNFRWHPKDYDLGTSVYKIEVNGEKIMEVIKLK